MRGAGLIVLTAAAVLTLVVPAHANAVRSYVMLNGLQSRESVYFQTEVISRKPRCWRRREMRVYRKVTNGPDQLLAHTRTTRRGLRQYRIRIGEVLAGRYYARVPEMRTERLRCRGAMSKGVQFPSEFIGIPD
jgi:hypothetical protein